MQVAHIALWTRDLEQAAEFWRRYFGADVGEPYHSARRTGFVSRFVKLKQGAQIELMSGPWVEAGGEGDRLGWDHIAISLGSAQAVDALASRCEAEGLLVSAPRTTGDGYYEAVISMPGGARIEITA